uniref:ARID domain-containing protein n=1 Tax=Parascaris univalens TaxID=6257 RepID=A0A915C6U8_PARUN
MQSDDPAFLVVGTEVSAKFKGAFCEAKVKRLSKSVKCKISLREPPFGSVFADHTQIKGPLEVNQVVEVTQGKETAKGVVQHVKDNSIYHVVFNDGDERQLRRTQVCPKGAKHFDEAVNLDALPLYNPEAFSTPVVAETTKGGKGKTKKQRKSQHRIGRLPYWIEEDHEKSSDDDDTESSDESPNDSDSSGAADRPSTSCANTRRRVVNTRACRTAAKLSPAAARVLETPRSSPRLRSTPAKTGTSMRGASDTDAGESAEEEENTEKRRTATSRRTLSGSSQKGTGKNSVKPSTWNRKKRSAATAAAVALVREAEAEAKGSDTDDEEEKGGEEECSGEEQGLQKANRISAKGNASGKRDKEKDIMTRSSSEEDVHSMSKGGATKKTVERKRRGRDIAMAATQEVLPKKKPKTDDQTKKGTFEVGQVVAVHEDSAHRGKWAPAVVVSAKAFKASGKGIVSNIGKNEIALRGFKDAKYFVTAQSNLLNLDAANAKNVDPSAKSAFDRASTFASKGTLPVSWERSHIFGGEAANLKSRRGSSSSLNEPKKEVASEKKEPALVEKKKSRRPVVESSSSSEATDSEEYGEERDQFTAQLYKFHEERGTPINRAPILGGKDIDMFRLYNVVQAYGGKKRVTLNNKWKKVLSKLRLEGCPGATPITVKNAYSRYLDHFNSFYRSLGLSNWPTTSTSSRSMRQIRFGGRENAQLRRKRLVLIAERKKEKEKEQRKKECELKERELKGAREREEKLKKEKAVKEENKEKTKEKTKKDDKETKKERESAFSQTAAKTGVNERGLCETSKKDEKDKVEDKQKAKERIKAKEKNRDKDAVKEKEKGSEKGKEKEQRKDKEKEKQKGKEKGRSREKQKDKDKPEEVEKLKEKEKDKPKIKEEKGFAAQRRGTSVERDQTSEKDKGGSVIDKEKSEREIDMTRSPEKESKSNSPADSLKRVSVERRKQKSPSVMGSCPNPFVKSELPETVGGSDDEGRVRTSRQREKRRMSGKERGALSPPSVWDDEAKESMVAKDDEEKKKEREKDSSDKKEKDKKMTEENYLPATVFTRFYMGQKVKAHHHGQWYDARVITVEQPPVVDLIATLTEFEKKHAEEIESDPEVEVKPEGGELKQSASSWLNDRLEAHLKEMRCFVHYLGWNARYDVWAEPAKIKTLEKDQHTSEKSFRSFVPERVGAATLDAAFAWRSSAVDSTITAGALTCGDVLGFGGFRPRRISISHYEQHLAAISMAEGCSPAPSHHSSVSPSGGAVLLHRGSVESRPQTTSEKRGHKKQAQREPLLDSGSPISYSQSTANLRASVDSGISFVAISKMAALPTATTALNAPSVIVPETTVTLHADTCLCTNTVSDTMLTTEGMNTESASVLHDIVMDLPQRLPSVIETQSSIPVSLLPFQSACSVTSSEMISPSTVVFTSSKLSPLTTASEMMPTRGSQEAPPKESIPEKQEVVEDTTSKRSLERSNKSDLPDSVRTKRGASETTIRNITCDFWLIKSAPRVGTINMPPVKMSDILSSEGLTECAHKQIALPSLESATLSVVLKPSSVKRSSAAGSRAEPTLRTVPIHQKTLRRSDSARRDLEKDVAGCSLVMKVEEEEMSTLPTTDLTENLSRPAGEVEVNEFEEEVAMEKSAAKHMQPSPVSDTMKCKVAQSYTESMTNESEMTGGETPAREADEEGSHFVSLSGRSSSSSHRHHQKSILRGAKRKRYRNTSFVGGERRPGRPSRRNLDDDFHESDEESGSDIEGMFIHI